MRTRKSVAGVARFAHLLGINVNAGVEDDDDDASVEAEDDEDDKPASKKAKKVEEDDPDMKTEADDDDEDDEKPASKKAKKAETDDDEKQASARRAGAKAERQRWATVLSSADVAGSRMVLACSLLTTTSLSAATVLENVLSAPADQRGAGLYAAMNQVRTPNPGTAAPGTSPGTPKTSAEMAAAISAAAAKARGKSAA